MTGALPAGQRRVASRRALVVATAVLAASCGPEAGFFVRVEAPLIAGRDCDALQVSLRRADQLQPRFEKTYPVREQTPFPVTLWIETSNSDNLGGEGWLVGARALLEGAPARPWAQTEQAAVLRSRETTEVVLKLCDCPTSP